MPIQANMPRGPSQIYTTAKFSQNSYWPQFAFRVILFSRFLYNWNDVAVKINP